jgi:hypothetical protein
MKRTILALTLTLALSSTVPVRASDASFTTPVGNIWANSNISFYYAILELFALGS